MTTEIYYYSGTGNCLNAAREIASKIDGSKIIAVAQAIKKSEIKITAERAIFVFPCFAYEMPKTMGKFLKCAEFESTYIAAVCCYASKYGAVFAEFSRILKKKGLTLSYSNAIKGVENFIPLFGLPPQEKIDALVKEQTVQSLEIAEDILKGVTNKPTPPFFLARAVSVIFKTVCGMFSIFYRVNKDCCGCGVCANLCPSNAIKMKDNKPKFTRACEHCQGCLNYCPTKSIRYVRYSKKSRRYTHPNVKPREINRHM